MGSQASVPITRSASSPARLKIGITFVTYALLLLAGTLIVPLRIPEILQVAAVRNLAPPVFFRWIAQAPGSSPLNPVFQLPFLLLGAHSRFVVRFLSLAFAIASCYLFLRVAKRIPLDRPYWALLLFMLLPVHFESAFDARPFEQALFLVVLATACFFRLISQPGIRTAALYSGSLLLCLYTDRYSFLPAIGYLLFLFRFADRPQERRAMWHALAATLAPVLLFLPYAFWAHLHVNPDWLSGPPSLGSPAVYLRALRSLAPPTWASYVLCGLLTLGVIAGAWTSFRMDTGAIVKRIRLFVLAGGVIVTIIIALALDISLGERFASSGALWAAPATVILVFAGIEWLAKRSRLRPLAVAAAVVVIGVCAAADAEYLLWPTMPREDLQTMAAEVPAQLVRDSCVVFVSEKLSRALFLMLQPELEHHECLDFFHSRVVLASHPYVAQEQQQDAESFFHGLNFDEISRRPIGGGQIVVMQQHNK